MSEPDSSPPNPPDWQHVKWYKPPEKVKAETSADEAESYGALAILFALVLGGAALVSPYVLAFIFGGGGGSIIPRTTALTCWNGSPSTTAKCSRSCGWRWAQASASPWRLPHSGRRAVARIECRETPARNRSRKPTPAKTPPKKKRA